ncbi:hypothetical protein T4B_10097, partial [Trichinella pseudospiralis]
LARKQIEQFTLSQTKVCTLNITQGCSAYQSTTHSESWLLKLFIGMDCSGWAWISASKRNASGFMGGILNTHSADASRDDGTCSSGASSLTVMKNTV